MMLYYQQKLKIIIFNNMMLMKIYINNYNKYIINNYNLINIKVINNNNK